MKTHSPPDPRCGRRAPRRSVASEPPRQLEVEGVEVDVADALEELGGPGVGQGLGQSVAPGLVLGLQLAELRPRPRSSAPGGASAAAGAPAAALVKVEAGVGEPLPVDDGGAS